MKRTNLMRLLTVVVTTAAVLWTGQVEAARRTTRKPDEKTGTVKKTRYLVVQIKDMTGNVSFEVIPSNSFRNREKQQREEYKSSVKQWTQAKAKARKAKEEFTDKKPLQPSMRKIGSTMRDAEQAKAVAQKYQERYEAMLEKKKKKAEKEDKNKEKPTVTKPEGEVVKPAETKPDDGDDPVNEGDVE